FTIEEVKVGMELPGVVSNLSRFGAFIDIGVKQDGLVHVSEIAHKYISDPAEVLSLQQKVHVKVLEVDVQRKRIALSIKQTQPGPAPSANHSSTKKKDFLQKPEADLSNLNVTDALSMLKKKFAK
ncbi:MAG: S1 RNA-binding domain-containing protein, partial [Chitinophagaceae bacterium]|nr:S1 RNA-binding domain-containing protein [Chitinophagaceae bacterium]